MERGDTAEQATGVVRADCRYCLIVANDQINQECKREQCAFRYRVLISDSLSTHLDQKSLVARFEKSGVEW